MSSFPFGISRREFGFIFVISFLECGYAKSWSVPISCVAQSAWYACLACVMRVQFFKSFRTDNYRWAVSGLEMIIVRHYFTGGLVPSLWMGCFVCFDHSAILLHRTIANVSTKWNASKSYLQLGAMRHGSLFRLRIGVFSASAYKHGHSLQMHIHVNLLSALQRGNGNSYEIPMHFHLAKWEINFLRATEGTMCSFLFWANSFVIWWMT